MENASEALSLSDGGWVGEFALAIVMVRLLNDLAKNHLFALIFGFVISFIHPFTTGST